ncbi:MAG TPA: hypothetical protein VHS97_14320 [Isosphaeraceae bacterium]|jgi:hypothetical protein|nr:hypothetical protein [Isosphaeraceae bacterium]
MSRKKERKKEHARDAKESSRVEELRQKWLGDEPDVPADAAAPQNGHDVLPSSPPRACCDEGAAGDAGRRVRLTWDEIQEIVRRDLPGHEAVRSETRPAGDFQPKPQAVSPDLEAIQEKYWPENPSRPVLNSVGSDSIPDEIVVVRLEGSQAPDSPTEPTRGPGLKVAVISGTEMKVIGLQG